MSFPPATEMFQFAGFASRAYRLSAGSSTQGGGCPIRRSPDQRLLAASRGLSQRATSFIASRRQGIHQMPFVHSRTHHPAPAARPTAPPAGAPRRRTRIRPAPEKRAAYPCRTRATETIRIAPGPRPRSPKARHHTMSDDRFPSRRQCAGTLRTTHRSVRRRSPGPAGGVPLRQAARGAAWWARADSNGRPHPYQGCALTG